MEGTYQLKVEFLEPDAVRKMYNNWLTGNWAEKTWPDFIIAHVKVSPIDNEVTLYLKIKME